ncbi:MAG: helix-turn-helix transcriptional regulator [Firmicutes bacterium]|nr:helix-turn-helix transcriptional regulator [Bacillota bacterium]
MANKFFIRLKELREKKALSQQKLGSIIGYSQSIISDWERNKIQPLIPAIIKVALYFNVSSDYLLGLEE